MSKGQAGSLHRGVCNWRQLKRPSDVPMMPDPFPSLHLSSWTGPRTALQQPGPCRSPEWGGRGPPGGGAHQSPSQRTHGGRPGGGGYRKWGGRGEASRQSLDETGTPRAQYPFGAPTPHGSFPARGPINNMRQGRCHREGRDKAVARPPEAGQEAERALACKSPWPWSPAAEWPQTLQPTQGACLPVPQTCLSCHLQRPWPGPEAE